MATSSALVGQTISHYRVIEKLGGGGMGVVYKACCLDALTQFYLRGSAQNFHNTAADNISFLVRFISCFPCV